MKAEFIYENIMKSPEVLTKFLEYNFIKIKNVDIITIDEFYSDSKSDEPLAKIAKSAFLVDGDIISPWVF